MVHINRWYLKLLLLIGTIHSLRRDSTALKIITFPIEKTLSLEKIKTVEHSKSPNPGAKERFNY